MKNEEIFFKVLFLKISKYIHTYTHTQIHTELYSLSADVLPSYSSQAKTCEVFISGVWTEHL